MKTVLLCVCGGIAAYKMPAVASALTKQGYHVHVLMTQNATEFIAPLTFEELTGNRCIVDMFDRSFTRQVEHVALAKQVDVCLIAPATANVIAKMAHGIADDMVTTTVLACRCPKLIAPAMNTAMLENPATQANLQQLQTYGFTVIPPACGYLACGDTGSGKLPEPSVLLEYLYCELTTPKDLQHLRILVTAGPTQEPLDPVRCLTNHSTGAMGYAIAQAAARRGAQVTLISGPTHLEPPLFVRMIPVVTAQEMYDAALAQLDGQDIIIKAAAVADYRPVQYSQQKIKKGAGESMLSLTRTPDILAELGKRRVPDQFLCGFCMETENLLENARRKLEQKSLDLIAANDLTEQGAGFGTQTNRLTLITKTTQTPLPLQSKAEAADALLTAILQACT